MLYVLPTIVAFFRGEYVPLSLMPDLAYRAIRFIPFTHVSYTPIMLLTGRAGLREGLFGLSALAAWTVLMITVSQYTYDRLRVKYEGVGI
jgi:ABC-2 type transport system permease protein